MKREKELIYESNSVSAQKKNFEQEIQTLKKQLERENKSGSSFKEQFEGIENEVKEL